MLGRYRLVRRLAVGGMAEIFLAQMSGAGGFEKNVVIKRMLPQLADDDELYRMFVDEARIAASLQHPHIVQVYDCGEVDGEFFIAMEYLDGADLQTLRSALAERRKGLPLLHTIHIASAVAAGLHYAHERLDSDGQPLAIVHRDVTPANVFLTKDGGIKLLDFGIAKAANRLTKTSHGTLKGKVAYMSPEQVAGEEIDRRSDVYSLGVLLYEMTTGRRLFGGQGEYQALKDIVEGEVPRPTALHPRYPPDLEVIILRALDKDRTRRYQTARELGQALDGFARNRRLILSSIGLAEYLSPVLEEAQRFASARFERMRERVQRASTAMGADRSAREAGATPDAIGSAVDRALAGLDESDGRVAVAAPVAATVPLRVASSEASSAAAQQRDATAAAREAPRLVTSDPDDSMLSSPVDVDLSTEDISEVRLRPRGTWRYVVVALLAAGGGAIALQLSRSEPSAPDPSAVAPRPGSMMVTSQPAAAEVWLSLGRAPVDSLPVDPAGHYRIRVEHEGYVAVDLDVAPGDFQHEGGSPVAERGAELVPVEQDLPAVAPPIAPAEPDPITGGLGPARSRTGHLRITASRAAAAVWLYLGHAPIAFGDLDPAQRYELKVAAPGHSPYYRVVEPRDFAATDRPIAIAAELRPLPASPPPVQAPARPPGRSRKRVAE